MATHIILATTEALYKYSQRHKNNYKHHASSSSSSKTTTKKKQQQQQTTTTAQSTTGKTCRPRFRTFSPGRNWSQRRE
jgi:hypothetical protein